MAKKTLDQCREGKDFLNFASCADHQKAQPVEIRWGKGDHVIVKTPLGMEVVPVSHELGKGLRAKIIKGFIAIGISTLLLFVLFSYINVM